MFKRMTAVVIAFMMIFTGTMSASANSLPGDVNGDGKVNMVDVVSFRRYLDGGYSLNFDKMAADVNNDQKKDNTDLELIRKYIVGGYGVELIPSVKDEYTVTYYVDYNDDYLKTLEIDNPNPTTYSKQEGLVLQDLHVDGYNFLGWFTSQSAGTQITELAVGTTGNKTLYAHWEKVEYKVQFACDMDPQSAITFYAGEEVVLPIPEMDKYTFVGWSDKEGNMWEYIPKGTAQNVTLYANWSSNRNKAVAKKNLGEPLIMEDSEGGLILFTYEIGEIQNVPLFTTLNLQCANGIITTVSQTGTEEISEESAKTIAKTVSSATTNSASWTLENNWSNTTEVSQSYLDQTGQTREEAESLAKSESGSYSLSTSNGGSSDTTINNVGAYNLSYNKAHSTTASIERSNGVDLSVDAKFSNEMSVGAKIPIEIVELDVSNKSTFEIGMGANYTQEQKKTLSGTGSWSSDLDISRETSKTTVDTKNWNTSSGYENSKTTSSNTSVANAVSKLISQEYGYGSSYAEGGSNSSSQEFATTDSTSDEYSSTVTYHSSKIVSTTKEFQTTGNTMGGYRMVMAGKIHVFAVVGYDIAEQSYFVYTYNVMDDKTEEYLDFSRDHSFNDYETSIIPFEIPSFVNDYVNARTAKTSGLQIDPDTGIIMDYFPDEENPDTIVVVPTYMSVDNGDGTFKSVKVKGIAEGLFKNNTNIMAVKLGNFITEIPDSAFEGCTNLKYLITPAVTKIGNNAFKGCASLENFAISADVTKVGTNAFLGAKGVSAVAANADVAKAIASSGAENIVLDISNVTESGLNLEVGEITSFELQGKTNEYSGLSLKSNAQTTVVNGVTFKDCTETPMDFSSANVTLNRVTATAPGYALVMSADNTTLSLNQTVNLSSDSENVVICKNVTLKPLTTSVIGKLSLTGNMLVAGAVTNEKYVTFNSGKIVYITDEEFENKRSSCTISFDANGGTLATTTLDVAYGSVAGTLPTPTYGNYTFLGWYTEKNGDEKITKDTLVTSAMTVYAKWNNWDGTSAEPEYDASTKTYIITTGNELAWISDVTNGVIKTGKNFPTDVTFNGYTIELANDIYLNDATNWGSWVTSPPKNTWKEISSTRYNLGFAGIFYGKNHNVYGLYNEYGLFRFLGKTGEIKNVIIKDGYLVTESPCAGAIVALNEGGKVSYCKNYAYIYVKDSRYTDSSPGIGGIVGSNDSEGGTILECENYGKISGVRGCVGGIIGYNGYYGKVWHCCNYAEINGYFSTAGGIAGGNEYSNAQVFACYNAGNVKSTFDNTSSHTGGIVGYNGASSSESASEVMDCHNNGKVDGYFMVGGIAGCNDQKGLVIGCYDIGVCTAHDRYFEMLTLGSIVGYNRGGTIWRCYSNMGPLYLNSDSHSGSYIYECKVKELKNLSNLTGFSTSVWATDPSINNGYPYLIALKDTY